MAETLIPLEEREEERRPSRVEPPRRAGAGVREAGPGAGGRRPGGGLSGAVSDTAAGGMTHRSQGEQSPLPSPTGTGSSPSWKGWR